MTATARTPSASVSTSRIRLARALAHLTSTPALAVLVLISCTLIAWFRLPANARDTFWAEDGSTFISNAAGSTPWATLVTPYAGYLHTIPRIEALLIAHLVPVAEWARAMTAVNCLVAGVVAAIVFVVSRSVVRWLPARLLIAGLTVLTPLASREVLGNAANLHSLLFWGLFWMLLAVPRSRVWAGALSASALLFALTEVQSIFLLPMLAVRIRDRRTWPVKAGLVLGAALQLTASLTAPRKESTAPQNDPLSIAFGWVINSNLTSWVPRAAVSEIVATFGPWVAVVVLIPLASLVVVLVRGNRTERLTVLLLLGGSVLVWASSLVLSPGRYYDYADPTIWRSGHVWLSRYGVVTGMMLLAITAIAAGVLFRIRARRPVAIGMAVVLAVVLLLQAPTTETRRSYGPQWTPSLEAARAQCATGVASVKIRETIGWYVTVPCHYLTG